MVRKKADIKRFTIDIKTELAKNSIDTKAVGKLMKKKYAVKMDKAMVLVNAYAELKKILTDEQKKRLGAMIRSRKK